MKYYSGSYGKDTIEQNALVTNLLKYPEISKALIRQYPQYSLTYFLEGTGRFAKEELIGDNAFKWAILGRLNKPSTVAVAATGTAFSLLYSRISSANDPHCLQQCFRPRHGA